VVHEPAALDGTALVEGLLQRVQHKAGVRRARGAPADDAARVGVDHESHVDEACPGRDIGEVRDPQGIRPWRSELPVDAIERAVGRRAGNGGADLLASHDALQAHPAHQARDRAAGGHDPFPAELPPELAHTVDVEVRLPHAPDLDHERRVPSGPRWQPLQISALRRMGVVGGRGDRQQSADRLDPVDLAMIVKKGNHGFHRRSSSAWAK
jgi:hypothetical protein